MKKKLLTVLVALAVLLALAVPNVLAVPYKDPGVSISESIDIQFPWDAETLVKGNSNTYDLNLAIGAGALCAAVESGTYVAEDALGDLGLAGTVAHYGYGANTTSVAHTIALQPVSVDGNDYNLITVVGRGSMSLTDIMSDITPGAFVENAEAVMTNLTQFLADNGLRLSDPANRFFVTGHSLGGAVANILGHNLTEFGVAKSAIYGYTFGTPLTTSSSNANKDNIFNFVGGKYNGLIDTSLMLQTTFDNFAWGSDETYAKLKNLDLVSIATDVFFKGRYGTTLMFGEQSDAFKAVYQTLTGKAYRNEGAYTLSRHLVTTYLAYILADQTVAVSVDNGLRTVIVNGGAPVTEPTEPVTEPTEPVTEPTEPVTEPTEPVTEPTEPVTEPTQPVTEPTEPVTEPTEPVTEPTQPVTEPTQPVTEPTQPVTEPTQPVTEPTQPVTEPTQPVTEPTQPVTEPTKPSGGSSGGGIFGFFTSIVKNITSIFRSIFRW